MERRLGKWILLHGFELFVQKFKWQRNLIHTSLEVALLFYLTLAEMAIMFVLSNQMQKLRWE